MNYKKKSIRNLSFLTISQIVTIAFSLLLPRLYMVEYGSEVNGLLNSLHQFLIYMGLFEAGIGATTLQALYGPLGDQDWNSVSNVLSATNHYYKRTSRLYLLALIILSIVYPIVVHSDLGYLFVMGVVFFSGIGNVFLFRFQGVYKLLLQADGRNYVISNITTILNICTNLAKIYFISQGWNIIAILAGAFIVQLIQIVYIVVYTKNKYKSVSITAEPNFSVLAQRNYTLVHQICEMIFNHTDVIILTVVCGLKTVSVYSMYKLVLSHLDSIFAIITNSINFALGQIFQRDLEKYKRQIDFFEICYNALTFSLLSVALFLLPPFIKLYTRGVTDFSYVDERLPILFVATALLTHMRVPMQYTINYAGHFKATTPQSILEALINLVVSIIGVYYIGIYGVLIGTVVALLYRTNDIIFYGNRRILNRKPWRSYWVWGINLFVFISLQFIFSMIPIEIENYLDFIIVGGITTMISTTMYGCIQIIAWPQCRNFVNSVRLKRKRPLGQ